MDKTNIFRNKSAHKCEQTVLKRFSWPQCTKWFRCRRSIIEHLGGNLDNLQKGGDKERMQMAKIPHRKYWQGFASCYRNNREGVILDFTISNLGDDSLKINGKHEEEMET